MTPKGRVLANHKLVAMYNCFVVQWVWRTEDQRCTQLRRMTECTCEGEWPYCWFCILQCWWTALFLMPARALMCLHNHTMTLMLLDTFTLPRDSIKHETCSIWSMRYVWLCNTHLLYLCQPSWDAPYLFKGLDGAGQCCSNSRMSMTVHN